MIRLPRNYHVLYLVISLKASSPAPVDGGWTSWTDSTKCSVTCGKGSIFRLRSCTNPAPQHGGKNCQGVPFERQECQNNQCPGNCVLIFTIQGLYRDIHFIQCIYNHFTVNSLFNRQRNLYIMTCI